MISLKAEIMSNLNEFNNDCVVSFKDVMCATDSLKPGKNDGHAGLPSNHIINSSDAHVITFLVDASSRTLHLMIYM